MPTSSTMRAGPRSSTSSPRSSDGPRETTARRREIPLILYTGSLGQFLYLLPAKDEFMVTPNMDHFGMEVSSKEELTEILERVKAYQSKDDRVRITDVGAMVTHYNDKRVHAHQRLHLVLDPALDRAPAHRRTGSGLPQP